MKRLLLLINPESRQGAQNYETIELALKNRGYEILNSKDDLKASEFKELIYKFAKNLDFVAIGGGDGSVNFCLEALVNTQIPMHLIPLGTANNMARTLEIPKDLEENLKILDARKIKKIDLGIVNDLYFVNVIGIGLSTRVNKTVSKRAKMFLGPFAFILKAFRMAWRLRPFRVGLIHDKGTHWSRSWQLTVCNGRHYGSGLVISENASLEDQYLECLSSEMKKWWHGLFAIPALLTGRHKHNPNLIHIRTHKLEVQTSRKMLIDVDGDIKTQTPAKLSIAPKALQVFVPV